jgi:predicted ATPase
MIKRLSVSNYRSLGENVSVALGPFTALVGTNGSGKSNVVDALRFVSDAMKVGLSGALRDRDEIGTVRRWSQPNPSKILIHLDLVLDTGQPASYGFEIESSAEEYEQYRITVEEAHVGVGSEGVGFRVEDGRWIKGPAGLTPPLGETSLVLSRIGGDPRFQPLTRQLQQVAVYSIIPDALRGPQRYSPVRPMDRYGSTWASILKDQAAETWKPELISALHKLTGDIEDVKVTPIETHLVVRFRHAAPESQEEKWLWTTQESDGTLRVAGILTALLQEPPVPVIVIEEPELTVHPGALPLLYDLLKEASRRSQIIVTTHSPELLDLMEPEEIRVVQRGLEGTTVALMAASQRDAVRAGLLTLGEVLRTEGLQQELPLFAAE